MPLVTERLHCVHAIVAKVVREGTETFLTVETIRGKEAYRFQYLGPVRPKVRQAILLSGFASYEVHRKKRLKREYYHEPWDGSDKKDWNFSDVTNAECIVLGPGNFVAVCKKLRKSVKSALRSPSRKNLIEAQGSAAALNGIIGKMIQELDEQEIQQARALSAPDLS